MEIKVYTSKTMERLLSEEKLKKQESQIKLNEQRKKLETIK